MRLILVILLFFAGTVLSKYYEKRRFDRSVYDGFETPHVNKTLIKKQWTFTDHETHFKAYKDKKENDCYIENIGTTNTAAKGKSKNEIEQQNSTSKILYAPHEFLTKLEAWRIAGGRIVNFCKGRKIILLQSSVPILEQTIDPFLNVIPLDENDIASRRVADVVLTPLIGRAKRQVALEERQKLNENFKKIRSRRQVQLSPGKFRGQTQSQYLSIGNNDQKEGKAEAEATQQSSRAVVSGSYGMGQAQSMSLGGIGCEECPKYASEGAPDRYVQHPGIRRPGDTTIPERGTTYTDRVPGSATRGHMSYPTNIPGTTTSDGVVYPGGVPTSTTIGGVPVYPGGVPGGVPGTTTGGSVAYPGGVPGTRTGGATVYPGRAPGTTTGGATVYPGGVPGTRTGGTTIYPGGPVYPGGVPGTTTGGGEVYPGDVPGTTTGGRVVYPGGTPGTTTGIGTTYPGGLPGTTTGGGTVYPGSIPGTPTGGATIYTGDIPGTTTGGGVVYPGGVPGTTTGGGVIYPGGAPGTTTGVGTTYPGGISSTTTGGGTVYPGGVPGATTVGGAVHPGGAPGTTTGGGAVYPGGAPGTTTGGGAVYPGGVPGTTTGGRVVYPGGTTGGGAVYPGGISGTTTATGVVYPGGIPSTATVGSTIYPGSIPGTTTGGSTIYPGAVPGTTTDGRVVYPGGTPGTITGGGTVYPGGVPGSTTGGGSVYPGTVPGSTTTARIAYPGGLPGSTTGGSIVYPGGIPGATGGIPGTTGVSTIYPGGIPGTTTGGGIVYPGGIPGTTTGGSTVYPGGTLPDTSRGQIVTESKATTDTKIYPNGQIPTTQFFDGGRYPTDRGSNTREDAYRNISPPGTIGGTTGGVPGQLREIVHYPGKVIPDRAPDTGAIPGTPVTYPSGGTYPGGTVPGVTGPFVTGEQPGISYPHGVMRYPDSSMAQIPDSSRYPDNRAITSRYPLQQGQYPGAATWHDREAPTTGVTGESVSRGVNGQMIDQYRNERQDIKQQYPGLQQYLPPVEPVANTGQVSQYYQQPGGFLTAEDENSNSQASSSVKQTESGTQASASAQGQFGQGTAQSQVSGTYTGSGSFSAQAGSTDINKSVQTEINGGKEGTTSNAQGVGGHGKSQAQVLLNSDSGATTTGAQSSGKNHGTNSQVQASSKGGMADAQANGEGSTSSQAQIGFQPYLKTNEKLEKQSRPFHGGGTASAQSGAYTGQSQSQLEGSFQYGITYTGAAQAGSGSGAAASRKPFNFSLTDNEPFKPFKPSYVLEVVNNNNNNSEAANASSDRDDEYNQDKLQQGLQTSSSSRRKVFIKPTDENSQNEAGKPNQSVERSQTDDTVYDYEEEYDGEDYDASALQSSKTANIYGAEQNDSFRQSQTIRVATENQYDVHVKQDTNTAQVGDMLQPGQSLSGYIIPHGFRGRVTSTAGKETIANGDGKSQSQTVSLVPKVPSVIHESKSAISEIRSLKTNRERQRNNFPQIQKQQILKEYSKHTANVPTNPSYYTITNSVAGKMDDKNSPRKYEHRYYTKSSTCGYFTFSCNVVYGSNGRTKICKPKMPTNPDGTPMKC